MSDRDALFQAILAAPDDDAPRLVYADWLDENGESDRAEFIRAQCRLARLAFYEPELSCSRRPSSVGRRPYSKPRDPIGLRALGPREVRLLV